VAYGVLGGVPAPDRLEDLRDHPSNARRGILSDGQQDVDACGWLSSVPPEVVIDVLAEGPMSAQGFVLGLSHTAVGAEG
jgi:hypothetical protein